MKIEVHDSKIEGKGVFASHNISKGELISVFRGEKISIPQLKTRYKSGKERIDDPFQISYDMYILLKKPYIYFNHSCSPNAGIRKIKNLVAIRNIKKGEEITYDYSTTEWTDDKAWGIDWFHKWKIKCKCSSKNCRKTIRIFPALPKKIQTKYYNSTQS